MLACKGKGYARRPASMRSEAAHFLGLAAVPLSERPPEPV